MALITQKIVLLLGLMSLSPWLFAQTLENTYDQLTAEWLEISGKLKTYQGLKEFCNNPDFRHSTTKNLQSIHHYDSLVLDRLEDPTRDLDVNQREYRKTARDIKKFERKYDVKGFMDFLRESCMAMRELENNKEDLSREVGMYSYDGQILILETDLRKFLKHIDKKAIDIDDHLHLLDLKADPDDLSSPGSR